MVFLVVVLAGYAAWFAEEGQRAKLRGDGIATLGWVANWRFVLQGGSYADRFTAPSPLRHAWSLAIEEQFYVLWPVLVIAIAALAARRRASTHRLLLVACVLGTGVSVVVMRALFDPLRDPSRAYYGTDTRAHALLIGAALAAALRGRPELASARLRNASMWVALPAFVALVAAARWADFFDAWLYRGGFALIALCAAIVILGAVQPGRNVLRTVLETRPLVVLGTVSYGLYLWHWPTLVVLDEDRTGLSGVSLLALQLGVTAALTAVSWFLIETPVQRGRLRTLRPALAAPVSLAVAVGLLVWATPTPAASDLVATGTRSEAPTTVVTIPAEPVGSTPSEVPTQPLTGPVKMLLVGDSVAWSLGGGEVRFPQPEGYASPFPADRISLWNLGVYACELLPGNSRIDGRERAPSGTCPDWREEWSAAVDEFDPDVVVFPQTLWDTYDHKIDGRWVEFGTPEADAAWRSVLDELRQITTRRGAQLVLLSSPLLDNDQEANTRRSEYWRFQHLSRIAEEYAKEHADTVTFLDLGSHVCTDVACPDGDIVRPDGLHYSYEGAVRTAEWLMPQIEAIAAEVRSRSATR
nr:acyltransferase family protein [uncultured bacterium]